MKHALIPSNTKLRTIKFGPMPVNTLKSGDLVVTYDMGNRRGVAQAVAEIRCLGKRETFNLLLLGVAHVDLSSDTVIVTRTGEKRIGEGPNHLLGSCVLNPNQLLTRQISLMLPSPDTETYEILWEGEGYLLAEGCLVGAYKL